MVILVRQDQTMPALYSVVIPVYKSEKTLEEVGARIMDCFQQQQRSVELVLVNDCSPDSSWEAMQRLHKKYPGRVTAVMLSRNAGQHKAILCGFSQCSGDFIITMDDDLQHRPEDIPLLIEEQIRSDADMVYAVFNDKKQHMLRNIGSIIFVRLFFRYGSTPAKGSSFRLIARRVTDEVKSYRSPYVFLDELLVWYCRHISFVDMLHETRNKGRSGYNFFRLISYTLQMVFTYTVLPLRFITWFGLLAFLACLGLIIYFLYRKFTYGAELGFTALIVSLFMSTGLILFSIGIIGEYISRLFILQQPKPPYIIKEILK